MRPWWRTEQNGLNPSIRRIVGVRSFTQTSFWNAYRHLPEHVQQQAREYRGAVRYNHAMHTDPGHVVFFSTGIILRQVWRYFHRRATSALGR